MKKIVYILMCMLCCCGAANAQVRESVSVLGDSYSTFEGYVSPKTNEMWYYAKHGGNTDVEDVTQTWWHQVVKQNGWKLCQNGGTNDSWAGEPVGDYKYEKWNKGDFYTFRPAMAYMLDHMLKRYPNSRLYIIINSELRDDITESMKTICQHYGVKYIQLKDIDKMNGHPSIKGMAQIAQQICAQL